MKRVRAFFLSFFVCMRLFADDGSFNAMGNTLFPLQETVIQLKKEKLDLTKMQDTLLVNVYFEFYNPGPDKVLTVGFVTPPAWNENLSLYELKHPQIKNFTVMVNDSSLSYKIYRVDSSGFKINDSLVRGHDFVYYFKMKFQHGKTIVRHSYSYACNTANMFGISFDYRLTTGTTWANHAIGDFELNINMGDDVYFYLPFTFNKAKADWKIIGIGRLSEDFVNIPMPEGLKSPSVRMAYIRRGLIHYSAKNFKPASDLFMGILWKDLEMQCFMDRKYKNNFKDFVGYLYFQSDKEKLEKLTNKQLTLLMNLPYARAGYNFKDPELKKVFSKCIWYIPDDTVKKQFAPYYFNTETLAAIQTELKRRKNAAKH